MLEERLFADDRAARTRVATGCLEIASTASPAQNTAAAPVTALDGRFRVNQSDKVRLLQWAKAGATPQRVAMRVRIVLMSAEGRPVRGVAVALNVNRRTVSLWRRRYQQGGPESLWHDAPGRGRPTSIQADTRERMERLLLAAPFEGRRWTVRGLARELGISPASVHRLLRRRIPLGRQL